MESLSGKLNKILPPEERLEGEIAATLLPNGQRVCVVPLTFGRARLCLCHPNDPMSIEDEW